MCAYTFANKYRPSVVLYVAASSVCVNVGHSRNLLRLLWVFSGMCVCVCVLFGAFVSSNKIYIGWIVFIEHIVIIIVTNAGDIITGRTA